MSALISRTWRCHQALQPVVAGIGDPGILPGRSAGIDDPGYKEEKRLPGSAFNGLVIV
jgi:hypothetical protein